MKVTLFLVLVLVSISAGGNHTARAQAATRLSLFDREKAEALLADRLPCLGCHLLDGHGGRVGPDLSEVGKRLTSRQIFDRVSDPQQVQPTSVMPRVSMPASWRSLIVRYLSERGGASARNEPQRSASVQPTLTEVVDGAAAYERFCTPCHGKSGRADGPNARYLRVPPAVHADAALMGRRTDDQLFDIVFAGGYVMNLDPFMPAYGETLSPTAVRAVIARIRALCHCEGPSWSRDGQKSSSER